MDDSGRDQDKVSDKLPEGWLSDWEKQTIGNYWEHEPNMDDRLQNETERCSQKLYHSFQNSATSIAKLYRDQSQGGVSLWVPFQNSASRVTMLYKDGTDSINRLVDLGVAAGQQRRNKDLLSWAKKRRRHIRREDLIAYLSGKSPPVRTRPSASVGRANVRVNVDRSSPRLPIPEGVEDNEEPDLRPFRDALALQRLDGAMSNISVGYPGSEQQAQSRAEDDEFHCFIMEEISRRCDSNGRKRSPKPDGRMDSPSRKRSRLL